MVEDDVVVVKKNGGTYLILQCGPLVRNGYKKGDKVTVVEISEWVYRGIKVVQR